MIGSMTSAGIFLWEVLALPFHTGRMALMNAFFRRQRHRAVEAFKLERTLLQEFLVEVRTMEQDLAEAVSELGLETSRQVVAEACQIGLQRLRDHYVEAASGDLDDEIQTAA
jgi:hypothetical protein